MGRQVRLAESAAGIHAVKRFPRMAPGTLGDGDVDPDDISTSQA